MRPFFYLNDNCPIFPDPRLAKPNCPLAIGGNLEPDTLLRAYRMGIFPWYKANKTKVWWSPHERMVLFPEEIHISKSMRSVLRNRGWVIRFDQNFSRVIRYCRSIRLKEQVGTWLHPEMILAYRRLHNLGLAHSVEVWKDDTLLGGLYGPYIAGVFSGESMFSLTPNSSKVALIALARVCRELGVRLIDCQIYNPHLERMGARLISRDDFLSILERGKKSRQPSWPRMEERPAYTLL